MSDEQSSRPLSDLHLWEFRSVRDVLAVVIVALLLWLGYAMRDVTVPLLVALLMAYLFEPLISWMTKTRWIPFGRAGAVSLLLSAIVVGVLAGGALFVPQVVRQATELIHEVQSGEVRDRLSRAVDEYVPEAYHDEAEMMIQSLPAGDSVKGQASIDAAKEKVAEKELEASAFTHAREGISRARAMAKESSLDLFGLASTTGRVAWMVIGEIITISVLAFLIPFYFFFFSLWYPHVIEFVHGLLPKAYRPTIVALLTRMDHAVAGFVRGRIVIALIMAVLYAVGWAFCGVPYAILLGVVVGAFGLVPYLGIVGLPLAIGMLALAQVDVDDAHQMTWWAILLWPSVVWGVVNTLDGWVLTPLIAGKATNLDPVTIFVAVLAGGSVMGVYGMLIAIPIAACIKILLSDLIIPKLREMADRPPARAERS